MSPSTSAVSRPGVAEEGIPDTARVHLSPIELTRASQFLGSATATRDRIVKGAIVSEGEVHKMLTDLQEYLRVRYGGRSENLALTPADALQAERFEVGFKGGEPVEVTYYSPNGMKVSNASGVASYYHQATIRLKGPSGQQEFQLK